MRRFEVNISCSSCKNKIEKVFNTYSDIKFTINIMEKMINIEADENKYPDEMIIEILDSIGYKAKIL